MIQVESDKSTNLLKIIFSRSVGVDEMRAHVERTRGLLQELKPGFRLLTDLSQLESMDVACAPHLERMMELFDEGGVARVVRVIPDPHKDIGFSIMSLFHYHRRIPIVTVETTSAALAELA